MTRDIEITWGPNRALVKLLSDSGARFMVVGGTALRFYNQRRRIPNDLDLLLEPSAEMLLKLNAALASMGEPQLLASPEEFAQPDKGCPYKANLNVDLLTPPAGVDFSEQWTTAQDVIMMGSSTRVRVASVNTLQLLLRVAQTRTPSRAQDFAKDLELLEAVRSEAARFTPPSR